MSATKFLTYRYRGPARMAQDFASLRRLHASTMRRHHNALFIARRGAPFMADPSWLSQFFKHNSKLIGNVLGGVPVVGGVLEAGFNALAPRSSNPMILPPGAGPLRKINGPTAGLAPAPLNPRLIQSSLADPFGTFADPNAPIDDGSDSSGIPPGVYGNTPMDSSSSSPGMGVAAPGYSGTALVHAIPVTSVKVQPRGYHVNRHGYWTKTLASDFSSYIGHYHGPGTMYVKNRRRNPLNPRALHRSISRLVSAKHAVHKLGLLDVPRRHGRKTKRPPFIRRRRAA
jgi:hypothetical protein